MKTDHWYKSHLREIPRHECLELLESQQVGRISFDDGDGPVVIPVNYAVFDETVLIATSAFGTIATSATDHRVAFEIDQIDDFNESGWSVLVRGRAEHLQYDELPASQDRPVPWAEGTRTYVLRITPGTVTGRRLIPA